jgi:phage baseplate assembly protein gpV
MTDYNVNVEYNNNNRPWTIYASKICSDQSKYEQSYSDISGLILEASNNNIDIKTQNGITKFHNDVSFNSSLFVNNIDGNIELSGNLTLNGGDITLNGGIIHDVSYITQIIIEEPILNVESLTIGDEIKNPIKIETDEESQIIKLKFF